MGIFGFKAKKDEVLEHWISFADGFNQPPQEFYALVKKELDARKIPSMEMSDSNTPKADCFPTNGFICG